MSKIVDSNSFWEIKHNPISKAGVFPYLGRSISDECEPDKIYYVFRSPETLRASESTWDNPPKPFINDHEMLGEGFAKIDERPVQGVIHNPSFEGDVLYADISVYSESLKDAIANGKKELSLGYFCKYRKEKGVYKGQAYDYVQEDMVGNHIALVDNGRCGSDVKVFDSKCTMDSLDIPDEVIEGLKTKPEDAIIETTTETKDSEMEKEEIKKEVEVKDEELEKKEEVKETVKDEDEEKKETKDCSKAKDEDEEKKETEDEEVSPADVMAFLKMILEEVRSLNGKKTTDEDEKKDEKAEDEDEEEKKSEDEDEEKKESEDEDEESEKKKVEDSAKNIIVKFAKDGRETPVSFSDDPALRKYLGI